MERQDMRWNDWKLLVMVTNARVIMTAATIIAVLTIAYWIGYAVGVS